MLFWVLFPHFSHVSVSVMTGMFVVYVSVLLAYLTRAQVLWKSLQLKHNRDKKPKTET